MAIKAPLKWRTSSKVIYFEGYFLDGKPLDGKPQTSLKGS